MKKQIFAFLILLTVALCPAYSAKFKMAVLPDTQNYSEEYPDIFTKQTQWIVNNKTSQSIEFVTHLGDVVEEGKNDMIQWARANTSMSLLNGVVPYSVSIGNHDYDTPHDKNEPNAATVFKSYFGVSRYSGYTWYKGTSPRGLSHYQIFSAGGRNWLHLNLEYEPDTSIFMWAQNIIDANPTLPVIISTHSFIGMRLNPTDPNDWGSRSNAGVMFYQFVSHNDQIFMILCGHYDGEESTKLQNDYGNDVFFLLTDYQFGDTGGSGWMRLYEFDLDNNQIKATTYSPWLNQPAGQYQTDANSQFTLNINFAERLSNFGTREQINGIQAANISVIEYDKNNTSDSVEVFIPEGQKTSDFNILDYESLSYGSFSNGDYGVQIGSLCDDDIMAGVLITSVAENSRVDTSGVSYEKYHTSTANIRGHGYFSIGVNCTSRTVDTPAGPMEMPDAGSESDVNVAAAYFPFGEFIGAHCEILGDVPWVFSVAGNGVVLGQNFTQYPASPNEVTMLVIQKAMPLTGEPDWDQLDGNRGIYELTLPDVNSMTDGIILASAGNDKNNYVICSPHPDGSGWQLATKTNKSDSGETYCNSFSFVYVPYDTPGIVAGRVKGNGQSVSGTGGYKIIAQNAGRHILKIYGKTPADGALLMTGESQWYYDDDIHTYASDDVNGCWVIESRELKEAGLVTAASYEHYVFAFVPFDGQSVTPFDGNGTLDNPFKVYTKAQLEAVDYWPAAHFKFMNNINLTGTTYTNSLIGIDTNSVDNGFNGVAFTGSFDGNGYAIQNLTMQGVNQDRISLFGEIGVGGQISNLTLQNVNIVSNSTLTGGLAGVCRGTISNCHITGTVQGGLRVGGLAGYCSGAITNCDSTATITGTGYRVGGLLGDCSTLTITNCYATGNVSSTGTENLGGLIGQCSATTVTNCYAGGNVTGGSGTDKVGGLIGIITTCNVSESYASGNVTSGGYAIGGFAGNNTQSNIAASHSTGNVLGTSAGTEGHHIGGFIGTNEGVDGSIAGISNCYATGSATGTKLSGGFIGRVLTYSSIFGCYAAGNAASTTDVNDAEVGGFAGRMGGGSIANCYATGSASGYSRVGGFAGRHYGDLISNCYSTGAVSGSSYVRGFVGYGSNPVTNSFWDIQTSGTTSGTLGVGKTTAEMKTKSTFTGWSFPALWKIHEPVSYPKLSWQNFAVSDLDFDNDIDLADLAAMAYNWLATGTELTGDIYVDNKVNFRDFAEFASDWAVQ